MAARCRLTLPSCVDYPCHSTGGPDENVAGLPQTRLSTGTVSKATDRHGGLEWSPEFGIASSGICHDQLSASASASRGIRPVAEEVKCGAGGGADIRSARGRGG